MKAPHNKQQTSNSKQQQRIKEQQPKREEKQQPAASQRLFQSVSDFFERHQSLLLIVSLVTGLLLTILLFDVKVSLSGDDSDYILGADAFWRHFTFPGFRGPLYPIILSPFIGIFGINLIVLKSLSAIFLLLSIWFLYKSFKGIIPAVVLMPSLLLVCICSFVFYYASQTYSEPLFMLVQSVFIFYFSRFFLRTDELPASLKTDWHKYLIIGVIALCMGLTRSIGYSVIGVVMLFFAFQRRWKDLVYTFVASVLVFFVFQLFKTIVWPDAGSAYDIKNYLAKDYYNPIEMENLAGFLNRLIENSDIYLSRFLCQMLGVIKETPSNIVNTNPIRTILIYMLFTVSLIVVFKRSKALLFTGVYVGIMNFFSFVLLQTNWAQDRLIVIYYPFILIFLLGGIYYIFQIRVLQKYFVVYLLLILVLCGGTLIITTKKINSNFPVLQENLLGNQLYGLTPDWQNFIKASQWAAKNLDKNAVIVSRKPSISMIYTGGREFAWAPTDITVPTDSLFTLQQTNEKTIVIVFVFFQDPRIKYIVAFPQPLRFQGTTIQGACVYEIPNADLDTFIQSVRQHQVGYTMDFKTFFESIRNVPHRVSDPDMMLNYLITKHIRYLLLAQLRVDPTQNTGAYINTTHRFLWYISTKYPNLFQIIHVEGKEEPCEIVEFIH